ncbi:nucleoside/nucleotide kinase family protein [Rothia uropygialis]|uniref:hypothetical protein n=1 Tax=Kocuria sp. 36 TaxID=1415402 RepID=UPI00101D423C|nr:hypothetical protein [Kocuria sp. 36]
MTVDPRNCAYERQPIWVMSSHTIVPKDEQDLWKAIGQARLLAPGPEPFVLAIDGRSGAGKSKLAERLLERARAEDGSDAVALFHLEDIYPGWEGLEEGVDTYAEMLERLMRNEDATWQAWDWTRNQYAEEMQVLSADPSLIIVEGVGSTAPGHPETRPHFGVWLHLEANIRKYRALKRDGDMYRPYWQLWASQEDRLFAR